MPVNMCCALMEAQLINCIPNKRYDADCIVQYNAKFDEYGLPIKDGGNSVILIQFCPWCGKKLPESKRDTWFDVLEKKGYVDPTSENVPEPFKDGRWWRT